MSRGLSRCPALCFLAALAFAPLSAAGRASASPGILQRFLAVDDPTPTQYRALRHLEARNDHFGKRAWMDVWTEGDASGFTYRVAGEEGSDYIRDHVFRAVLDIERRAWASGACDRAGVTPANYTFTDRGAQADGLATLAVKPRRNDVLLVDGAIFLNPDDGELVRIEGRLSKTPSFWMRQIDVIRWYRRIAGVRMPVAIESVADVRLAGESTFRMTYEYESINGQTVGAPQARASAGRR
jgi:hypothetical protein